MFICWRSRTRTSLSPGLKPAVCGNKISSVSWGSSFSLSLTDWIPVKTTPLPLPTQLLLVHRHRLHLRAHTGCMRYQVRTRVTRRHIYLRGGNLIVTLSFPASPWLTRCCAKTRGSELWLRDVYSHMHNIRGPPMIKENTPIISIMMHVALSKCHHQYVCQVPWAEARAAATHQCTLSSSVHATLCPILHGALRLSLHCVC